MKILQLLDSRILQALLGWSSRIQAPHLHPDQSLAPPVARRRYMLFVPCYLNYSTVHGVRWRKYTVPIIKLHVLPYFF